jgi:SAM-dependent methyltransferase
MSERWKAYYEKTKEKPHESLIGALAFVSERSAALDLGAGALADSKYLLAEGFKKVVAVDSAPAVAGYAVGEPNDRLAIFITAFDSYEFPHEEFDLANAQYSLPFNAPDSFETVFARLKDSLKPGGIFVGQLFGPHDSWSGDARMSFHSIEDARRLLDGFDILELTEEENDGTTKTGVPKHWHVIRILARKRTA